MSGVRLELDAGRAPDVEDVTLDLRLPVSVDVLVELTRLIGKLDPDAVIRTDSPAGVARLELKVDRRALRRRQQRRQAREEQ